MSNKTNCISLVMIKHGFPDVALAVSMTLAMIPLISVLNSILIAALVATKQATQNTSNLLILCLSVSDFITGAIILPIFVYVRLNGDQLTTCTLPMLASLLSKCFSKFSSSLTVLIAVDRYLHMNFKVQAEQSMVRKIFKVEKIGYLVTFVFIVNFSLSIVTSFFQSQSLLNKNGMFLLRLIPPILGCIFLTSITFLYIRGFKRICTFTEDNAVYREQLDSGEQPQHIKNLFKTVLVLILLAFISFLPYSIAEVTEVTLIVLKKPFNKTGMAYFTGIAKVAFTSGAITNCLAVFHYNRIVRKWSLKKFRIGSNNAG